jgi:hypothetical protein
MFTNAPMPQINLAAADLSSEEYALCLPIVSTKGKNKGALRASKPSGNGDSAYIWRMVAFQISPIGQHHCLPMCADFDIEVPATVTREERYEWRKNRAKELNAIADKLVNQIPKSEWHGIRRWKTAMYG